MLVFSNYNYAHFSRELLHQLERPRFSGPGPGDRAPDFEATTLAGKTLRLSDYRGKKNVLLIFGSVTCPMTAASIGKINRLYEHFRGDDMEFLFVYVREAHPGERIPAHRSGSRKVRAAKLLRDEERIMMPVLADDLRGSLHGKYSMLPNPAFLIDKSGRVAFRAVWANPDKLELAIEELLELQQGRGTDHAVVTGGQDLSMPLSYAALDAYRALERGGEKSVGDFRAALGLPEHTARTAAPAGKPLLQNPGRALSIAALTTAVLAGGLYAGFELRRRRLSIRRNPYRAYEKEKVRAETGTDYGAVGI